jgi:phosphate starvation-inducible protein PhoH and related proteins
MTQKMIIIKDDREARNLFGKHDENLKRIEKTFCVKSSFRDGSLKIVGSGEKKVTNAEGVINEFLSVIRKGVDLSTVDIDRVLKGGDRELPLSQICLDRIEVCSKRRYITPRSVGQKKYIDAIKENDVVFSIGPAGTGKTYLAMAMAVNALKKNVVSRIILTRPAVEAGESLGYLPGDIYEKVNPYLRPLYDALLEMVEPHMVKDYIDRGIIEVAPLAFMRGRTLNDSFIIMDEAQNSTPEQMKMFLTRLGFDSKVVIAGDLTQSDLPRGKKSGLLHVKSLLNSLEGVKFVTLKGEDVVRHEIVQKIIEVYNQSTDVDHE